MVHFFCDTFVLHFGTFVLFHGILSESCVSCTIISLIGTALWCTDTCIMVYLYYHVVYVNCIVIYSRTSMAQTPLEP